MEVCRQAEAAGAQPFPGNAEHLQSPASRTGAISKGLTAGRAGPPQDEDRYCLDKMMNVSKNPIFNHF